MSAKAKRPRVPPGFGKPGKALWLKIMDDLDEGWKFDNRELHILAEACRTADDLGALDRAIAKDGRTVTGSRNQVVVHPGIAEVRQLRALQLRLLSSLEIRDPSEAGKSSTPAQSRARHAAETRWAKKSKVA